MAYFLFKESLDILPYISELVNCSLSQCAVRVSFNEAFVSQLIKKYSLQPDELKNYQPVTGLGYICELVEDVMASQVNDHVISNGLEHVIQSVYKNTRLKVHCCQMQSILLLLELKLLMLFSLTN